MNQNLFGTIGIFNDSFPPVMDGVSIATQNYAYWLHKKDQDVCVVTPKSPNTSYNEPFPVHHYTSFPIPNRKPYRLGVPEIDMNIHQTLKDIPFALIHAHSPFSAGNLALKISKRKNIPLVATFHSKYRDDFERSFNNRKLADLMVKEIVKFYDKADEVWIPQAATEDVIREYGYKGKLTVVDNGNDFSTESDNLLVKKQCRDMLFPESNELIILFVGQHIWEKDIKMIIDSLSLITDIPFKMIFIGAGYAEEEIKSMVKIKNLQSSVEFKGIIRDREILKQYYAAADLFFFPSRYDNAPLVVREAGALFTPSLLSLGSTSSEIITDNYNGFLAEFNAQTMADKIRYLYLNPETLLSAGLHASQSIARSWENISDEILDRYKSLVKRKMNG